MNSAPQWDNPNEFTMVFRCTRKDYAEALVNKGILKFNSPESWVNEAELNGEGRGDRLEGTIAAYSLNDINTFIKLYDKYKMHSDLFITPIGEYGYLKRRNVMKLPCYCFFILKNSMFDCPSTEGRHRLKTTISGSYFRDFANNLEPEEAEKLPENEQPSIVIIKDFDVFRTRLKSYLLNLGLEEEEIIDINCAYYDFGKFIRPGQCGWCDLNKEPPYELSIKSKKFEHQSEARFIINTKKKDIQEYLLNNVIEIGTLEDIAESYTGYLHGGVSIEGTFSVYKKT